MSDFTQEQIDKLRAGILPDDARKKPAHLSETMSHKICSAREANIWVRKQLIDPETHAEFEENFFGKMGFKEGWDEETVSADPEGAFLDLCIEMGKIWRPVIWVPEEWEGLL